MSDDVRSDWYPRTPIFRQRYAGDWMEVLSRVEAALSAGEGT